MYAVCVFMGVRTGGGGKTGICPLGNWD